MSTRRKPRSAPDVDALMQRWPIDGPYSDELVLAAAQTMVELVRYINNATLNDPDATLPVPEISGKLAYYLQQVALRLQQTVHQLLPPQRCWTMAGMLTITGSARPQDALDEAASRLAAAESGSLATLYSDLGRVHSLLNRLAIEPAEED
jgi:hypothetical protein